MIGKVMLLTIAVLLVLFVYTLILVQMIQSIRYDSSDKGNNITLFIFITIVILSGILALLGI